jgi:hypothetical protein
MQLKILKSFNYGSVSDSRMAIAGNTMESDTMDAAAWMVEKWIRLGWAVGIDATELGI